MSLCLVTEVVNKAKEKIDYMAAANKAKVVYVHDKQKPAAKQLGLNLMMSMLSQLTNSNGEKRLAEWVDHLAEILIIL